MDLPKIDMPRLIARQWRLEHADAALAIYGHPEVMHHLGRDPMTDVDRQREYLEYVIERNASFKPGFGSWPLFEKQTDVLVGAILLKPLPDHEEIEVGWHLARSAWGKGYATEAGRAAIIYGFRELGLETIYAVVDPENERSLRVCRRIGMTYEGRTTEYYKLELELFSIQSEATTKVEASLSDGLQ